MGSWDEWPPASDVPAQAICNEAWSAEACEKAGHEAWAEPSHETWVEPCHETWVEPSHEAWDEPKHEAWDKPRHEAWDKPSHEAWDQASHEAWAAEPGHESWDEPSHESWDEPRHEAWAAEPGHETWDEPSWDEPSHEAWDEPSHEARNEPSDKGWAWYEGEAFNEPCQAPASELTEVPAAKLCNEAWYEGEAYNEPRQDPASELTEVSAVKRCNEAWDEGEAYNEPRQDPASELTEVPAVKRCNEAWDEGEAYDEPRQAPASEVAEWTEGWGEPSPASKDPAQESCNQAWDVPCKVPACNNDSDEAWEASAQALLQAWHPDETWAAPEVPAGQCKGGELQDWERLADGNVCCSDGQWDGADDQDGILKCFRYVDAAAHVFVCMIGRTGRWTRVTLRAGPGACLHQPAHQAQMSRWTMFGLPRPSWTLRMLRQPRISSTGTSTRWGALLLSGIDNHDVARPWIELCWRYITNHVSERYRLLDASRRWLEHMRVPAPSELQLVARHVLGVHSGQRLAGSL